MAKLILATTSKFKSDIMNTVYLKHGLVASDYDESQDKSVDVYQHVKNLSLGKAKSVLGKVKDSIVIGLDTVCYVKGKILEKPNSVSEAKEHIRACSGDTTLVITGLTIINQANGEIINTYVESKVSLREISEKDIDFYIKNEPGYMYSSGFVLETVISNYIDKIEGSYYNILGVPVETIYKYVSGWGYSLDDLE